jgi:hypothetical protein
VPDAVVNGLSSLPSLSKQELCRLWQELFKVDPPSEMQNSLMVRTIGYRLQSQAFGQISSKNSRRLLDLARQVEANPNASLVAVPVVKPGTRLIRQWKERTHVVTAEDKGYAYDGSRYANLSQIARLITGTNWSGPLFFGLKQKGAATPKEKV